ncbi:hypothetical protein N8Z47_04685 [Salibacteraceae bacterium]|jgi:hypothetical protein|nr:hypothetical protein [Salibacteraceae bacterium]
MKKLLLSISLLTLFGLIAILLSSREKKVDDTSEEGMKSSIEEFEMEEELRESNVILNPEILPFCKVFISEKFHKAITKDIDYLDDPIQHTRNALSQPGLEVILFIVFVGQSERIRDRNPGGGASSDFSSESYFVKNSYYTHSFLNYMSDFLVIKPDIPAHIDDAFTISQDTLLISSKEFNSRSRCGSVKLHPINKTDNTRWLLNDTIALVDVSYLQAKLNIPETQIEHRYLNAILELYLQEKLPKQNDRYLPSVIL